MADSKLDTRGYAAGDESQILSLFQRSYGTTLDEGLWRWRFLDSPGGPGIIRIAWDGDVAAGHYAVSLARLWCDGKELISGLSGTTMVDPDHRGLGLFPMLARETYAEMEQRDMCAVWGFPNSQSHAGFIRSLGWIDIHEVPFVRLRVDSIRRPLPVGEGVREITSPDSRFDRLWNGARNAFDVSVVRDRKHAKWRFVDNPCEQYTLLACPDGDELAGWAAYKRYGRELQVVDLLTNENADAALELIGFVVAAARKQELDSVALCLPVHHPLHLALERHGFSVDAPVTYFGGLPMGDHTVRELVAAYSSWYLTMADSDVF